MFVLLHKGGHQGLTNNIQSSARGLTNLIQLILTYEVGSGHQSSQKFPAVSRKKKSSPCFSVCSASRPPKCFTEDIKEKEILAFLAVMLKCGHYDLYCITKRSEGGVNICSGAKRWASSPLKENTANGTRIRCRFVEFFYSNMYKYKFKYLHCASVKIFEI
jgi:hypothetical protein